MANFKPRRPSIVFDMPPSLGIMLTSMSKAFGMLVLFASAAISWAQVPDFHLQDTNPYSARYTNSVSPRDYLFQVSGYYFETS